MPASIPTTVGMPIVLAAWGILFLACAGVGLAVQVRFFRPELRAHDWFAAFWLGWGLLLLFLQVWHLFAALNLTAGVAWVIIGLAALFLNRRILRPARRRIISSFAAFFAVIFLIWLANRAMAPIALGDTGGYHLTSVRWNSTYPIVRGLGNLHGRLAYNSAFFLFAAMFEPSGIPGYAYHFTNGLLLAILGLQTGSAVLRLWRNDRAARPRDLFDAALLLFYPYLVFSYASNLSNDLAVFALGWVIGGLLCELLFEDPPARCQNWLAFNILFLAAAGISIKLSFIGIGGAASTAGLIQLLRLRRMEARPLFGRMDAVWLVALGLLGVWIYRGYLLSGYPGYPSTLGGADVQWRVPADQAELEARWIASWGRQPWSDPDEVLGQWDWLIPKLRKGLTRLPEFLLPLAIFGGGAAAYLIGKWRHPQDSSGPPLISAVLLTAPAIAGLAFWFFSSPNIRFVGALFWWLAAAGLALNFNQIVNFRPYLIAALLIALGFLAYFSSQFGFWVDGGMQGGFDPAQSAPIDTFETRSGLILNIPEEAGSCWNAELPCTPYRNENLRLIEPGRISGGFYQSP